MQSYKTKVSFESRLAESKKIREKFPGRIPIIVERAGGRNTLPAIDKVKFLTPADLTLGQFNFILRKRMTLPPEVALFVFVNNELPTTGALIREIYTKYKDQDGFLYLTYCGEATFG